MKELEAIVKSLLSPESQGGVLATLATVTGSSYRRPGARLLVSADGRRIGSISGGCLEEDVLIRAKRVAETGLSEAVIYDTTSENDLVWGVGLGCHGIVRVVIENVPPRPEWAVALAANFSARQPTRLAIVHQNESSGPALGTYLQERLPRPMTAAEAFLETVPPPTALFIFGAGDDAQPLARLAFELGWRATIADPRAAFATRERFPTADRVVVGAAAALVEQARPTPDALAVVMTHHYVHDLPLLRALLPRPLAYLGLLGPKKRAERILADLEREGLAIAPAQRERLHAPVGLDLGADTPEQVALAIIAEMQAVLAGRDARPLRNRTRPIHG